jgi:formylmethanofuran--tetrahydromethanopterin N-formyltransferase
MRPQRPFPRSLRAPSASAQRGREGVISQLPEGANSVLEIVVDGLDRAAIERALRAGIDAECSGVVEISAGNYGGKLGKHQFHLHELLS